MKVLNAMCWTLPAQRSGREEVFDSCGAWEVLGQQLSGRSLASHHDRKGEPCETQVNAVVAVHNSNKRQPQLGQNVGATKHSSGEKGAV